MHFLSTTAAAAALPMAATAASADCADDLAQLEAGVSKDGSMAPLRAPGDATPQTGGAATATTPTDEGEVATDGGAAPLQADPSLATSAQDAQAQSAGGATAAEQAAGGANDRIEALARAQAALADGDEQACLSAVEEAKGA